MDVTNSDVSLMAETAPLASISDCLVSADPLADAVVDFLLHYQEEDSRVDYKLTMDGTEKEWLEFTKDISAFANTVGGYLVVGVRNRDKALIGIDDHVAVLTADVNNIQQKVNRHLEPDISLIRSKVFMRNGLQVGVIHIPASTAATHVVSKDGSFALPSGDKQTVVRKGTLYVRRSAGNHLVDSRDLDEILDRRMAHYREILLNRIAKVVEAPRDSEVFVLSKDPDNEQGKRFIIRDGPEAIPVKGLSFSVAPEGIEEQIAAWKVIASKDPSICPPCGVLWGWYLGLDNSNLSAAQRLAVAQFAMWRDAPVFVWLKGLRAQDIQKAVLFALEHRPSGTTLTTIFRVAAFLGRGFYTRLLSSAGKDSERLAPAMRKYPDAGPGVYVDFAKPPIGVSEEVHRKQLVEEAMAIAREASSRGAAQPGVMIRNRAHEIDCYLYAQLDKYA